MEPGPDFSLSEKDLESALKILVGIKVIVDIFGNLF